MKYFVAGILLVSNSVMAQNYADVISVQPNMVTVNEQRCEQVAVQRPATSGDTAGGIFGAIAGAAIGNQIGGGSGKDIATAAGAAIGSQIGRGQPQPGGIEYQNVCKVVPMKVQRGETVTFRYRGRVFTQSFE